MFIYIWENKIDGKKYLGKCQKSPDSSYIGSGKYFKRAVKKYGIENFERTIIEECTDPNELIEREKYWLDYYDCALSEDFYNISPNSGGGHHGADYNGKRNPMYRKRHPNHKPHYGEANGMFGVHRYGSDNPNAKKVKITDPSGTIHTFSCIKEACNDLFGNSDNYGKFKHMVNRTTQDKTMRKDSMFFGWKGELINE